MKGTAEAFIEAADDFDASKDKDLTATTQDVEQEVKEMKTDHETRIDENDQD